MRLDEFRPTESKSDDPSEHDSTYCENPYCLDCNYHRITCRLYEIGLYYDYSMQMSTVASAVNAVRQPELAN